MIGFDNELWVIEMTVVTPPFVLDFAGVYLDSPPPYFFDAEIMSEWETQRRELFEDDWADVVMLLAEFRKHGIYLNDVKPGNVTIRQW